MRFSTTTSLVLATAVTALPSSGHLVPHLLARSPEFTSAFNDIVARAHPDCVNNALNPCCDADDCKSVDTCYGFCDTGDPSPGGPLGCVAGCATACPQERQC